MRTLLIPSFLSLSLVLTACGKPATPPAPATGSGVVSSVDVSKIETHLEPQTFDQIVPKAQNGDAGAQFELGAMYEAGDGVTKDLAKAVEWYGKAAAQGNRQADFNLGIMYKNGTGVTQSYAKAISYFQAAEKLGEVRSAEELGLMYYTGNGATQDFDEAKKHFEKAALGQLAEAQVNLGVMYVRGEGGAQDVVESYAWFAIAAENQSAKGMDFAEKLKPQLTPEQISKAEKRKNELQAQIKVLDKNTR